MDLFDLFGLPAAAAVMPVRFESSGPYAIRFDAYQHCKCVAVLRGWFDLQIIGEMTPVRIEEGDCYLLSDGRAYRVFNADVAELAATEVFAASRRTDGTARLGTGTVDTILNGARLTFDVAEAAWLHRAFPPIIHMAAATEMAAMTRATLSSLCRATPGADPYV